MVCPEGPPGRSNGAVLIDFENIRLAWQNYYYCNLSYPDLCAIVEALQERFEFNAIFIGIYATEPKETLDQITRQLTDVQYRKKRAVQDQNATEVWQLQRKEYALASEIKSFQKLIKYCRADQMATQPYTLDQFSEGVPAGHTVNVKHDRLGGIAKESRPCQVKLDLFGLKNHQGRRVQRGCDAQIVRDLMILTFSKAVDSIWLLTGDSDFTGTMEKNAAESPSRSYSMLSFLEAMPATIRKRLERHTYPHAGTLTHELTPGEVNEFAIETALPGASPLDLMRRGKRCPRPTPGGASIYDDLQGGMLHQQCAEAAENRWSALEKSSKNLLKSRNELILELEGVELSSSPSSPIAPDKPPDPNELAEIVVIESDDDDLVCLGDSEVVEVSEPTGIIRVGGSTVLPRALLGRADSGSDRPNADAPPMKEVNLSSEEESEEIEMRLPEGSYICQYTNKIQVTQSLMRPVTHPGGDLKRPITRPPGEAQRPTSRRKVDNQARQDLNQAVYRPTPQIIDLSDD